MDKENYMVEDIEELSKILENYLEDFNIISEDFVERLSAGKFSKEFKEFSFFSGVYLVLIHLLIVFLTCKNEKFKNENILILTQILREHMENDI